MAKVLNTAIPYDAIPCSITRNGCSQHLLIERLDSNDKNITIKRRLWMAKITDIEGIGQVFGSKLENAGVPSDTELLKQGCDRKGRKALAKKTGVDEHQILQWVNRADLSRVKGIGSEYSDLLEEAGVDTVPELAQRNAANLYAKMVEVNEAKKLVRKIPTENQVTDWVKQAKELPRVVTY